MPCSPGLACARSQLSEEEKRLHLESGLPTVHPLLETSVALCLLHLPPIPAHSAQRQEKAPLPKEGESSVWALATASALCSRRTPRSGSSGRECSCLPRCASWEAQTRRQICSCLVLGNACSPSSRTGPLISQAWNFLCLRDSCHSTPSPVLGSWPQASKGCLCVTGTSPTGWGQGHWQSGPLSS